MATKPELRRAVANSYIKASDYNYNFEQLNNYIESGIASSALVNYEPDIEYKKGQWVLAEVDEKFGIYESVVDGNKGTSLKDVTYWKRVNLGSGYNLFDTKISDHILEGNEVKGWALQGTYVTKESYPDFYSACLAQKESSAETQVTLGESVVTMFKNSNGHQFFNIADKAIIDTFYETFGVADFYGIDEENERIFLPRNKYFHQLTDDISRVNEMIEDGLPNIEGYVGGLSQNGSAATGAFYDLAAVGAQGYGATAVSNYGASFSASKSNTTYGNSDTVQPPSSLKLLYYCVGNTETTNAITNVIEMTTSENDTIPLFTGMYFDFKPNNPSWLKAGEQQNNAGIYKTCYETLVEIVNGINNYDLKVINHEDMVSGVVYDEYWILYQDNFTFRTPLTIATKSLSGGVCGDGTTLGLTNGVNEFGLNSSLIQSVPDVLFARGDVNVSVGSAYNNQSPNTNSMVGVSSDSSKSGIIAEQSTAQLYFKVANAVQNLELLDVGEVLEGLADKISRQDCAAYVIETYKNGASWYRVYSDGWCEQGGKSQSQGYTDVNLLKSYANLEYSVLVTNNQTSASAADITPRVIQLNQSSFRYWAESAFNNVIAWRACGYIE